MFYTEHVQNFQFHTIFKPIIDDIRKLEAGVDLIINGVRITVYGTLTAIVADNLASHEIGGFKKGFSKGYRKCRFCLAVDKEIQKFFTENKLIRRTKEQYDRQCVDLVDGQPE